jgi:hypothetical protein
VLAIATAALVLAVPLLARIAFDADLFSAELSAQRESAYDLMRYCMPQVFFYGVFVLLGQMLNARQRFGPMMWAPIVNNLVGCGVLGAYIALHGSTNESSGFTRPRSCCSVSARRWASCCRPWSSSRTCARPASRCARASTSAARARAHAAARPVDRRAS